MENWDEVRTAFQVARMGTVSGAAAELGVHHATVIRHIDAIEARLGVKLFQRHARGYTPTEAGHDLLRVAQATDEQFHQLMSRIKGQGADVSGELVVTSLINFAPLMVPALTSFQEAYPDVIVRFMTDDRVFRLEYGEAHIALRAGAQPDEPDNVVQRFMTHQIGMYASEDYVAKFGRPETAEDLAKHRFVGSDDPDSRAPFLRWLKANVPRDRVVFRTPDVRVMLRAVAAGVGIGFVSVSEAEEQSGLVEIMPPLEDWTTASWLVTHVDLHRSAKVQAFLKHIKQFVAENKVG